MANPHPVPALGNLTPWTSETAPISGRKTAGATIKEWINVFIGMDLSEDAIRAIARGKKEPASRRIAAERLLRSMEAGDIADFEPVLSGQKKLDELRADGVNTEVVKKSKTRIFEGGIVEREIELHDRAGADFDRVVHETDGNPKNTNDVNVKDGDEVLGLMRNVVEVNRKSGEDKQDAK